MPVRDGLINYNIIYPSSSRTMYRSTRLFVPYDVPIYADIVQFFRCVIVPIIVYD